MQPSTSVYLAIGIPGTTPSGPGTAECVKCRTRKKIATSTALTIFELKSKGVSPMIMCWDCLQKDPEALKIAQNGVNLVGGALGVRKVLGLGRLDDVKE